MAVDFTTSPRPTVGVEWEFALVDRGTRDLSNTAGRAVRGGPPGGVGVIDESKLHRELLRNTVEVVTGICEHGPEAMADLAGTVRVVRRTARELGVDLYSAGTHPFAEWSVQQLTPGHRYEELISRTQWWGRQMLIWGLHVHVGVGRKEHALPIVSSLLNHFPHLQALSASSPVWSGTDTGYASNRAMMFQQLPTAGLPFQFQTWEEYEALRRRRLPHRRDRAHQRHPLGRPAGPGARHGRGADLRRRLQPARAGALTALTHCLVVDLERRLEAGERLPVMPPWHVQENKWRAARYGLDAEIILDAAGAERLVTDDLDDLLERLTPLARELRLRGRAARRGPDPGRRGVLPAAAAGARRDRGRPGGGRRLGGGRAGALGGSRRVLSVRDRRLETT